MRRTPDLTGQRFGRLLVKSQTVETLNNKRQSVCYCRCDCGREVKVAAFHLAKADGTAPKQQTRSCGCLKSLGDLTGQRFGLLTVMDEADPDGKAGRRWNCRCNCGHEIIVAATSLAAGLVQSCGCLNKIRIAAFTDQAEVGARASHTPEANAKRTQTVYGQPGSEARKQRGVKLREDLEKSGAISGRANIAKIADDVPQSNSNSPYRGVCWTEKKSWTAYCRVNGIRWQKSGFRTPEEAKEARDKKQQELIDMAELNDAVKKRKK